MEKHAFSAVLDSEKHKVFTYRSEDTSNRIIRFVADSVVSSNGFVA